MHGQALMWLSDDNAMITLAFVFDVMFMHNDYTMSCCVTYIG